MPFNPPDRVRVSRHYIQPWAGFPNSSVCNKPLYIYHGAFSASRDIDLSSVIPSDVVVPQWEYSMYTTSHFHSNTPEVLFVVSGSADLCFGGPDNPHKLLQLLKAGDVVIVPPGVAHNLVEDRDGDFQMVGCYPPGKSWDMCYGKKGEKDVASNIEAAGWLKGDPVWGDKGPVVDDARSS
ncbi:Cupin, RmlC-type [Ascosphaera apis ARSEF 7405]|uniref:Cupin, RmlC-type n=1 Tax=Ascosphaera apis ARSEF 7405 TaxID=392613 RepID=A0A166N901_9EURO|nr:Cupin, RmlC-type [Ascosphaera apis ARSEF 7405]